MQLITSRSDPDVTLNFIIFVCLVDDVSSAGSYPVGSGCHFHAAPEFGVGPQLTLTKDGSWIATYRCLQGYRLTGGSETIVCKDGELNGTVPSCRLGTCEKPPMLY